MKLMRIKYSKIHGPEDEDEDEGDGEDGGDDHGLGRCLRYTSVNLCFHVKGDCFCWEKRKSLVYWKEDSL